MFQPYIHFFQNENVILTLKVLYYTGFVWVPALLMYLAWELWVRYRHELFFAKQTYILLEVKLPRDVFKSPQASEFFISGLYTTLGEANWFLKFWKGSVRSWFSLEIASIDGGVHFFIWCKKGSKTQIEANLYSQYPGIEIFEVPDYVLPVSYDPEKNSMWACEFDLTGPDVFPIKTYIDYKMDKDPKEEYKIDPITPLIDAMGSLGRGHQAWLQIIIRAHKAEDPDPEKPGKFVDLKWKNEAKVQMKKILDGAKGDKDKDGKPVPGTGRFLTDGESETIKALERSISKAGFDVGMRLIYIANKDVFTMDNVGGLVGGVTHFNSPLNGFKPARGVAPNYSHPLLVWKGRRAKTMNMEKQFLLDAYKRRAYFYPPFKSPHFVLNTEELATLYHFPGGVAATPTFARISSKKAEAPANIPL